MSDDQRWNYLTDMDGVLVHEQHLIPGADEFLPSCVRTAPASSC